MLWTFINSVSPTVKHLFFSPLLILNINLLQERCVVREIGSSVDYRKMTSVWCPFPLSFWMSLKVITLISKLPVFPWTAGWARFLFYWQRRLRLFKAKISTIDWARESWSTRSGSSNGKDITGAMLFTSVECVNTTCFMYFLNIKFVAIGSTSCKRVCIFHFWGAVWQTSWSCRLFWII